MTKMKQFVLSEFEKWWADDKQTEMRIVISCFQMSEQIVLTNHLEKAFQDGIGVGMCFNKSEIPPYLLEGYPDENGK